LKWNSNIAPPLLNGSTYNVEINVKVNGVYTGFCPSTCTITIDNGGGSSGERTISTGSTTTLWPNPVRDGQVHLNIDGLAISEHQVAVDVRDVYGKLVYSQEFSNTGEHFNTLLQLPGMVVTGVYMVNITVDGVRTAHRLSIIR
jgi:hypothetical protein